MRRLQAGSRVIARPSAAATSGATRSVGEHSQEQSTAPPAKSTRARSPGARVVRVPKQPSPHDRPGRSTCPLGHWALRPVTTNCDVLPLCIAHMTRAVRGSLPSCAQADARLPAMRRFGRSPRRQPSSVGTPSASRVELMPHARTTRIAYRIGWALTRLKRVGLADNRPRRVWSLTEHGRTRRNRTFRHRGRSAGIAFRELCAATSPGPRRSAAAPLVRADK